MVTYSAFEHPTHREPISEDYRVFLNGQEIPAYTCRISAYPFNRFTSFPQRPLDQTEMASYVNIVADEAFHLEIEPLTKTAYQRIMVKPYSKGIKPTKKGERIALRLSENGGYVLMLDDYHHPLYIFNNKPCPCPDPAKVTHYFGKGVHFPGKITLSSDESVYLEKDALVYGCIYAENAANIHIFGNGILNDSTEERINYHCYEDTTNGNLKFFDCRNLKIEGIGITDSAIWCCNLFHCFDVIIDGLKLFGQWRYNTDGIDIVNSQRVTIRNSFIHSFDDSITIKGVDRYSFENCTDILVEDCTLWCDWGRTLELGLETECREYKNITFRRCAILRGGSVACDIQNGDRAEVHHVLFEDISLELEHFYTPEVLQQTDDQVYDAKDQTAIARFFYINNHRFREAYADLVAGSGDRSDEGKPFFAAVHDVTLRNMSIYCDQEIAQAFGTRCAKLKINKIVPTADFSNLLVENVTLNGKRLSADEMDATFIGCESDVLTIL